MSTSRDFNRSLSQLFTNPVFREVAQTGTSDYFLGKLKKYDAQLSLQPGMQVRNVIENAYGYLGKNYRNEYVYKNTILNNILLGRHSLNTATLLNEFKVAGSIADTVIINGTSTVYEIKTELDTPDKLQKQLEDYRKVFEKLFLVTHHSLEQRYLSFIKDSSVGLLSLSGRFNLKTVKDATEDYTFLDTDTMMKALRKEDYCAILIQQFGSLPEVPNIRFFSTCLQWAKEIKPAEFHQLMMERLRKRVQLESGRLGSASIPKEIKHICHCINPTIAGYNNLSAFLNHNL